MNKAGIFFWLRYCRIAMFDPVPGGAAVLAVRGGIPAVWIGVADFNFRAARPRPVFLFGGKRLNNRQQAKADGRQALLGLEQTEDTPVPSVASQSRARASACLAVVAGEAGAGYSPGSIQPIWPSARR